MEHGKCPVDQEDTAEAYLMGTLSEEEAAAFEDHYIVCPHCAAFVEQTAEYIEAMRAAAKDLRSVPARAASGSPAFG